MYVDSFFPLHLTVPQTGTFFDIEISLAKKTDDMSKYNRRIFKIGSKEFLHS
jgi:hypothetical protein